MILAALDQKRTARPSETELVHNRPIEAFARHAWVAGLNVSADPDGVVRRLTSPTRTAARFCRLSR